MTKPIKYSPRVWFVVLTAVLAVLTGDLLLGLASECLRVASELDRPTGYPLAAKALDTAAGALCRVGGALMRWGTR